MRPLQQAVALFALTLAPSARAELYPTHAGTLEAGLELCYLVGDSDDAFDELDPVALFGLRAGLHVADHLRLGLGARASLSDPEAERYELLADLTWSWVDEPRLPDPPALRLAGSLRFGWAFTELLGSDFVVTWDGLFAALGAELGLVVFERTSVSLTVEGAFGDSSNRAVPAWAPSLRLGLALSRAF